MKPNLLVRSATSKQMRMDNSPIELLDHSAVFTVSLWSACGKHKTLILGRNKLSAEGESNNKESER